VFIPNLGSYQVNEVAIQPKDIPLDYELSHSAQKMRPPFRAGSVARFDLRRIRAVSGTLKLRSDGVLTPLENYKFVLDGTAGTAQISTIRDGNFYIENIIPGRYSAELNVDDKRCRVEALIPDTNEIVTDLGDLICERIP
jgi:outer membrane usher protein FimD/PapC